MNSSKTTQNYKNLPHILVVDDDARIRELVCRYLHDHDFIAMEAVDAQDAQALLVLFDFDALVLDVMMPGETGMQFTQSLREQGNDMPVLLLTAMGEGADRIAGFEAGADDYLPKPFEPKELVLRLKALLKRAAPRQAPDNFRIGDFSFNEGLKTLASDSGKTVMLTDAEVLLLKSLASRRGEVVSRDELADMCGVSTGERTIDVQVTRLRRKIEPDTKAPIYLQTLRGKGYLLRVQD